MGPVSLVSLLLLHVVSQQRLCVDVDGLGVGHRCVQAAERGVGVGLVQLLQTLVQVVLEEGKVE